MCPQWTAAFEGDYRLGRWVTEGHLMLRFLIAERDATFPGEVDTMIVARWARELGFAG